MKRKPTAVSEKILAMNEALMLGSLRQHALTSAAETANARLQREITERKQAEAALRESERRYRTLFDLGPVAVYSCDVSGRIQQFNPRAAELWGRHPTVGDAARRFCGSHKMLRANGNVLPREHCPMAKVARGQLPAVHDQEVIIERPDGSRITVVVNIAPLKNDQGKITGAINCFYDITERKQAEEAQRRVAVLAATNQKLELEIAQRRKAQAALQTSKKHQTRLLEESRRMRDQLRLLSRQVLLAQEEERKRISRELHDVIAQALTGINLQLASLKLNAPAKNEDRERNITRTQLLVDQSVNLVHQFARELRPPVLDDIGMIPAFQALLKAFKENTGVQVSLSAFAAVEEIGSDIKIVFYRIAQEALTNVARHAQATRVDISFQKVGGFVKLKITDDGRGLPLSGARKSKRLGVLGMRERLEIVDGNFAIESPPGKGTTVTALIPLGDVRAGMRNLRAKAAR